MRERYHRAHAERDVHGARSRRLKKAKTTQYLGESSGAGDYVNIVDRSIRLQLVVELTDPEDKYHLVTVTPKTFQHISGSPQPRELAPDDPNLPGWVQGRVDSLHVEIHKRLQNYAVK